MKEFLRNEHIEYALYHLGQHVELSDRLRSNMLFLRSEQEISDHTSKITFLLSDKELDQGNIKFVEDLPILFPVLNHDRPYYIDNRQNLVFTFDVLKSVFYLLSGYQEYINQDSHDNLGRFAFKDSIQFKLRFVQKPLVNYYFRFIVEALQSYSRVAPIQVKPKRLFPNFGFMLTHDIDSIDLYTWKFVLYKVKELVGIKKSRLGFKSNFRRMIFATLVKLKLAQHVNPHWNFEYLRELESRHGFNSVWYFLEKGVPNSDSDYSFDDHRLPVIYEFLKHDGCEIGLHGPVESIDSKAKMTASSERLSKAAKIEIKGVRQHRLLWKHPLTATIQERSGFIHDSTLGFAAHEGFRNSYCYPFKLFDFESNKMSKIWELPLNVMDGTLFVYQNYDTNEAMVNSLQIVDEVIKFGGLFTLLWHNSFFDDESYPGLTKFYEQLLEKIANRKPESITGAEMAKKIDHDSN